MDNERLDISKIKPLNDNPSDKDEFEGNSHKNVANALIQLISKNKIEGGYAIGLEGSWGSGKSTVINIVADELNATDSTQKRSDFLFFNFDTWARQGDPIKRSFLESFINFLDEKVL